MYTIYILFSEKFDKFYVGQTNNFSIRLKQHNDGKSGFTKLYRPWKEVLLIKKDSRSQAMELERKLKNLSKKRLVAFIAKYKIE